MQWVKLTNGSQSLQLLGSKPKLAGLDPHLIWGGLRAFRVSDTHSRHPIPVLFEAREVNGIITLPDKSLVTLTAGTQTVSERFLTGFAQPDVLVKLARQVKRLRIGATGLPMGEHHLSGSMAELPVPHENCSDELVIGIIDHGIGFANRHFATVGDSGEWQSRIESLWDQQWGYPTRPGKPQPSVPKGKHWTSVMEFGYGRELLNSGKNKRIDYWLNQAQSEAEVYRQLQYGPAQGAVAHGTHVLGLAAGNRRYVSDTHQAPVQSISDKASQAKIIAVQLPALPYKDTSGIGLCVQVMDAISYIHLRAAGRKVVINLSDGAYAGPHDGTSLLERAIDDFYGRNLDRSALVVAAGNQFNERIHWQSAVPQDGGAAEPIHWNILPDDSTDSHLEIWPDSALTQTAIDQLKVRVTPPGHPAMEFIRCGQAFALFNGAAQPNALAIAMVAFVSKPPNASPATGSTAPRAMIHIAVAATRTSRNGNVSTAPHGIWRVELVNDGPTPVSFNAYIERDNPALGDSSPIRQSHFVHPRFPRDTLPLAPLDDSANPSPVKRMGALNNIATANRALVVGGVDLNIDTSQHAHPQLAAYSASGPGRGSSASDGVDLLAPSDSSPTIRGIRGCATRSGVSFRMDGTSVSTAQVTRAMANLMAAGRAASDAKQHLIDSASPVPGSIERVGAGRML